MNNDIEKIYIISIDNEKVLEVTKSLSEKKSYEIANTFNTDISIANLDLSDQYIYYVSEDQLSLDYKNNALLYVITNSQTQESVGIAIDEFYNTKIIPMPIKGFNIIKNDFLANSLVVWIDTNISKKSSDKLDYKLNLIESKYLFEKLDVLEKYNGTSLYFTGKEKTEDIVRIVIDYLDGDDEKRKEILEENC